MPDLFDLLPARLGDNSTYRTTSPPPPEIMEMSPRTPTLEFYSDIPEPIPNRGIGGKYLKETGADDPLPNRRVLARMFSGCPPARKGANR